MPFPSAALIKLSSRVHLVESRDAHTQLTQSCWISDLKPGNVVVDYVGQKRERSAIAIIRFWLVEDENTTIEGFRRIPPWVAPEVGSRDGLEIVGIWRPGRGYARVSLGEMNAICDSKSVVLV